LSILNPEINLSREASMALDEFLHPDF